ncbi:hypothetical protein P691DRAFT_701491 [Macrolepiota fuliginosa MF-IS2]|uniref:Uncharacterized protein n=1 Tax=Macrolepiota fuliginosa MF-IS2 TaxID=1400762 RepID=A0A9P5XGN0_9AGAR|nr:hypothetical protein P691DRAFT_701491 [Macrolepiota fuliginosa MF-IS2]
MLCKRLPRFKSPLATHCRFYSAQSTSPYPFRNLRAFPFNLSPYDAQRYISPFASVIRHEGMLASIGARIFPALGFEPLKPARFTPVYFPGWFLDAEVKGEVSIKGDDRQATAQIHNAYIPGSDYQVISSAPIAPDDPHLRETIRFSEDLLRQHDLDVACIPYNISPFSIINIAHHLSYSEAKIAPDFRFSPSSIQPTLFAAYPVLIPLYLAQYEYETDTGTKYHTFIVEAYGPDGNVWSEPFSSYHTRERDIFNQLSSFFGVPGDINPVVTNFGYPKKFVEIAGFSLAPHQELGHALRGYLESALTLPSAPTALAAASVTELGELAEDKRVREFIHEERTPIIEWLKLGTELMMVHRMHEVCGSCRCIS